MEPVFDSQSLGRRVNELLILNELSHKPKHGYQMALDIEERSEGYFPFNHGTLYPILHRLEKEGFIAGDWSDPTEGRSRKRYALTEAGRTYLAEIIQGWTTLQAHLHPLLRTDSAANGQVRSRTA